MVMCFEDVKKSVMSEAIAQFPVLGLPIHLLDDYSKWLTDRLHQRIGTHVVTLNSEMVMLAEHNDPLANVIRQAELIIPDGAGIVLYLRLYGRSLQRCPGIELAGLLLQEAGKLGQLCPVFFFGGAPGVAESAAAYWQKRIPDLAIAGTQNGFVSPDEEQQLAQTLKNLQPRLILVGLGVPRQEFWIAKNRHLCPDAIWIGVGGSFDIWAGVKSRAPALLRDNNLEWLYRLYKEPWRWRRMLALPQFALRVLKERFIKF